MERFDFMEFLGTDISVKILLYLEDPSDIIHVSAVSSHWRQFVINNGICKRLCMKMFPEISTLACTSKVESMIEPMDVLLDEYKEMAPLRKEHRVYSFLVRGLDPCIRKDCIFEAISASSTDNYPEESICNTLEPGDKVGSRASYWSSKGAKDPTVPETLTYRLASKLCVITEIRVRPFQAFFQFGFPLYSVKAVRFLMGHPKVGKEAKSSRDEYSAAAQDSNGCNNFEWTYISRDFPMAHENLLQVFKLPVPVICIGGILQVQLLGRVQKQEMDGLYYVCISHVQVLGRPLSSTFDVEILEDQTTGKCGLMYCPEKPYGVTDSSPRGGVSSPSGFHRFSASIWEEMIFNTLLEAGAVVIDDEDMEQLDD